MTKDDFYILRNSITMMQLANFHGFKIIKRGGSYFTLCPFHNDQNASMQIFEGNRGFYCRGCGTGGDINRFTELYENLTPKEAGMILAERFNIQISERGEVSQEAVKKAQKAEFDRQQHLLHQRQIKADLKRLGMYINTYKSIIDSSEPFSDLWNYCQNESPKVTWEWEIKFNQLRND